MKAKKALSVTLWLLAFIFLTSCSKKETLTPTQGQKTILKDIPELIESNPQYALLDQYPAFPGGDSLFREYLKANVRYPREAVDNNIKGKVFSSFIIERDGSISNLEILRGIGYGCDDEVLDVLRNMPAWTPGKIQNTNVRVKLVIPVVFK